MNSHVVVNGFAGPDHVVEPVADPAGLGLGAGGDRLAVAGRHVERGRAVEGDEGDVRAVGYAVVVADHVGRQARRGRGVGERDVGDESAGAVGVGLDPSLDVPFEEDVDLALAGVGDRHGEPAVVAEVGERAEQADSVEEVLLVGVVGPHQQAVLGDERAEVAGELGTVRAARR